MRVFSQPAVAEDVELELNDNEDYHLSSFFEGGTSTTGCPKKNAPIFQPILTKWGRFFLGHPVVNFRLFVLALDRFYLL